MTLLTAVSCSQSACVLYVGHYGPAWNETPPVALSSDLQLLTGRIEQIVDFALPVAVLSPPAESFVIESLWGAPATVLDGASFGLALLLGAVSRRLGLPIPPSVCALAAIDMQGRTRPVDLLELKLDGIAANALAVEKVLIPESQRDTFEIWQARAIRPLQAIPVASAQEAVQFVFPDPASPLRDVWESHPQSARMQVRRLFDTCFSSRNSFLDWHQVAKSAEILQTISSIRESPENSRRILFVRQVARRHAGIEDCILPWPDDAMNLPRLIRLHWMAHALQSLVDSSLEYENYCMQIREARIRAERHLARCREASEQDWILYGAIGRARAACHEYAAAEKRLRQAVFGWFSVLREAEASIPLCEWMRVLALQKRPQFLRRVLRRSVARVLSHPGTSPVSRAYVHLAAGRALTLVNECGRARDFLDSPEIEWSRTPAEVQASRLRWLARASDPLDPEKADAVRAQLASLNAQYASPLTDVMHLLSQLDAALRDGRDPAPHLQQLTSSRQQNEVKRQLAYARQQNLPPARTVADHYRY